MRSLLPNGLLVLLFCCGCADESPADAAVDNQLGTGATSNPAAGMGASSSTGANDTSMTGAAASSNGQQAMDGAADGPSGGPAGAGGVAANPNAEGQGGDSTAPQGSGMGAAGESGAAGGGTAGASSATGGAPAGAGGGGAADDAAGAGGAASGGMPGDDGSAGAGVGEGSGGDGVMPDGTAVAMLTPTTAAPAGWEGFEAVATFTQVGDEVSLVVDVTGCPDGPHISHLHANHDCGADGEAAGGHWVPNGEVLDDMICSGGVATYMHVESTATWTVADGGPNDVTQFSYMIHELSDAQGAGARVACGSVDAQ